MSVRSAIREIHLLSAVALAAFVVLYFATGWVMTKGTWFPDAEPQRTTRVEDLDPGGPGGLGGASAPWVRDALELRGRAREERADTEGHRVIAVERPGYAARVVIDDARSSATVTEERHSWKRVAVGLHRLHGYGGGWRYALWAFVYDLVSLAMIVFALSGVWLWYQTAPRHGPGFVVLGGGIAFTLGTIAYLLLAP